MRDQFLIVHGDLAVEGEGGGLECGKGLDQLVESLGMVEAVAADKADRALGLGSDHPLAVHLLLVDPAGVMDRAGDFGGVHELGSSGWVRLTGRGEETTPVCG